MRLATAIVALICLIARGAVAVAPPAALVMAISGAVMPEIAVMSEIPSDVSLKLAPAAELTFLHYGRCKLVTVSGGTLTVTRQDYFGDAKILSETPGPCPHIQQLNAGTEGTVAGGLVMRGLEAAPRWPLNPELIIAGAGTDRLTAAAIYAEARLEAPLVRLEQSAHHARFPADAAPLPANERYVLRLTLAGRTQPVDLPFIGAPPNGPSVLVVLRGP